MIYYLVIGYVAGHESEGLTLKFREEKTVSFLREKFVEMIKEQNFYAPNEKIFVDWILKSKSPIKAKARIYWND